MTDRKYMCGECDVMALALNRLYNLPFGVWAGKIKNKDDEYEFAHAVVVINKEKLSYMDVLGLNQGVPNNLYFENEIEEVVLLTMQENDIREIFTTEEINEEQIHEAMDYFKRKFINEDFLSVKNKSKLFS